MAEVKLRKVLEKLGQWLFRRRGYLPLLLVPIVLVAVRHSEDLRQSFGKITDGLWESLAVTISLVGLAIRCVTVGYVPDGTSGRNTKKQKAHTLNTTGMYSLFRHPLYLGNILIFLGIALFVHVWWFIVFGVLGFCLYYRLISFAEEEFLRKKFGSSFLAWAGRTPAFWSRFRNWKKPELPFSFRNVLKREYTGFFVTITSFTLVDFGQELLVERKVALDDLWVIFFVFSFITYLTLRTLKKKTSVLKVEGR